MCGIAGIINGASQSVLERMAVVQAHRGPDDAGVEWFADHAAGLAHRRLSIIDLSPAGHQPMANARGTRWITFNGEIYNYRELRAELSGHGHRFNTNSDTEVILAAYDQWGVRCVERFNGMFAFGIYDTEARELFLARDHLGVKPLYYAQRGGTFAFASEAKALFEIPGFDREINPDAVTSALLLLWVPEPASGFMGVEKLLPGHFAVFRDGRLSTTQYWEVPVPAPGRPERRESDLVEELDELLVRAVRRQMIADVPVGAFLSGGLDSSLILALMRHINNGPISTYTISFSDRDKALEAMPDDARYAAQVARQFGTDHHVIEAAPESNRLLDSMLYHLDDPVCDGASINTYLISAAARERGTTVLLNGMGGDEVFGGYRRQLATLILERYRRVPGPLRSVVAAIVRMLPVSSFGRGIRLVRWAKKFLRSAEFEPLEAFIHGFSYFNEAELRELLAPPYNGFDFGHLHAVATYRRMAARADGLDLIDRMTWLDTTLFLPGLNLLYSDKASMAASIESRPPLVDVELVEFAAALPSQYKIHGRVQKYLLKRVAEKYLPREIVYRPKAAFGTPIRAWMARDLAADVRRMFTAPSPAVARFIRPELPLRMLAEHAAGREDHAHQLWGVFATGRWAEMMSGNTGGNTGGSTTGGGTTGGGTTGGSTTGGSMTQGGMTSGKSA